MKKILIICKSVIVRNVIATIGTAIAAAAALTLFSAKYTCCYEFFADGKSVGFSQSADFYERIKADVNSEIAESFGEGECITSDAETSLAIIKKSDMTDYQTFFDNVASMSACMVDAHTLVIDGEDAVSFATEQDMNTAMRSIISEYSGGGDIRLSEDIASEDGYVSAMKVFSAEEGEKYIRDNGLINASSVVIKTYTEPIVFEEQTVENADMYEDERAVVQQGENGEKTVNAKIILQNGVETAHEIISETVTKQPVVQICSVGIKPIPDGIGTGDFIFPTMGTISSHFGTRWGKTHEGLDIANSLGTDIYASDEGQVIFSGVQSGYGNIIVLDHGNGYTTKYAHCSELLRNEGDIVGKGDVIAKSGNTGRSTGNHVHFEICKDGTPLDPLGFVRQV